MTLTLPSLVVLIVIAAIRGAVGKALAGDVRVARSPDQSVGALHTPDWRPGFLIIWSIVGATLFVAVLHLLSGRR